MDWWSCGWKVNSDWAFNGEDNTYDIWDKSKGDYQRYPRWFAMGHVLSQINYHGFDKSQMFNGSYVTKFINSNFPCTNIDAK